MQNVITWRTTLLGMVSWLVPFVVSFLFVDRTGQFVIPQPLFKSIMIIVAGGLGAALLVVTFRRIAPTLRSGLIIGCYWMAINLCFDLALLLPLTGMPLVGYIYDIGLRYLIIPIMAAAIGATAERASPQ